MKRIWLLPLVFILAYVVILFRPFLFGGKLPIPADTIVGLYHPWRDFYADQYPSGIPFKNFLITDPVRQQYLWRQVAVSDVASGMVPSWNPYNFAGTPLLANLQSAIFYPFNLLFLLGDFATVWSWQIILQLLLGGVFMYLYLRHLDLKWEAVTLGTLAWLGSGFVTSWLEWNTLIQSAIWLPLILLAVDKVLENQHKGRWLAVFIFSLAASFLAGHLQVFFYTFLAANFYAIFRSWESKKIRTLLLLWSCYLPLTILISLQLFPTLAFIQESARNLDQSNWSRPEWFIPWQNLVQFIAPDFFGNPATLNYFGTFSYQEFVGYLGIAPLVLAISSFFLVRKKITFFFGIMAVGSLLMALPNPLANLPFTLKIPLVAFAQPTRLIYLVDFSLAVLAAIGLDQFLKSKSDKKILVINTVALVVLTALFVFAYFVNQAISMRNLYLPIGLAVAFGVLLILCTKLTNYKKWFVLAILLLSFFDLSRFAVKFESFSPRQWLFPKTNTIAYLQDQAKREMFRIAAADDRIMPPNFSLAYRLQTISGYDPLYLSRYGKLIAAIESNNPNLASDLGFNRIVVPKNYTSKFFDLLNVKYLLTLNEIKSSRYQFLAREGQTQIYKNTTVLPRAFFVSQISAVNSVDEGLQKMFAENFDPAKNAVVEGITKDQTFTLSNQNQVTIVSYEDNRITIETKSPSGGFLVLTDNFYPGWQATIDGIRTVIFPTDVAFRGIFVPSGDHTIIFQYP